MHLQNQILVRPRSSALSETLKSLLPNLTEPRPRQGGRMIKEEAIAARESPDVRESDPNESCQDPWLTSR